MRCRTTANFLATATVAFLAPMRLASLYQSDSQHYALISLVAIQKDRDALRQTAGRIGIKAPFEGQVVQSGDPSKDR